MVNNFGTECLIPLQTNVPKRVCPKPADTNPVRSLSLSAPRRRPADGRHAAPRLCPTTPPWPTASLPCARLPPPRLCPTGARALPEPGTSDRYPRSRPSPCLCRHPVPRLSNRVPTVQSAIDAGPRSASALLSRLVPRRPRLQCMCRWTPRRALLSHRKPWPSCCLPRRRDYKNRAHSAAASLCSVPVPNSPTPVPPISIPC